MQEFIDRHGYGHQDWIMATAYELATKYGEAAASVTCDLYDAIAETQGVSVPAAEPAKTPTTRETRDVINYALKNAPTTVPAATGKLVKKTSTRTIRKNASRDNAMVALVPSGDGCVFCKMLGSRGWEPARHTKSFEAHLHNNCRCEYVVRFNNNLRVAGYDPEALLKEFNDTGESTWPEKMKAVRRKDDAERRENKTAALSSRDSHETIPEHDPPEHIRNLLDGEDRRKVLLSYEKEIKDEPIENAIVITRDGEIFRCRGDLNGVYPGADLGDKLIGADVTHNHPEGSDDEYTFSSTDFMLFNDYQLNTLRGVDPLFEYILNRNPDDIDEQALSVLDIDEYSARHFAVIERAKRYGYGYRRKKHTE